jgi:hypothetical protein
VPETSEPSAVPPVTPTPVSPSASPPVAPAR